MNFDSKRNLFLTINTSIFSRVERILVSLSIFCTTKKWLNSREKKFKGINRNKSRFIQIRRNQGEIDKKSSSRLTVVDQQPGLESLFQKVNSCFQSNEQFEVVTSNADLMEAELPLRLVIRLKVLGDT